MTERLVSSNLQGEDPGLDRTLRPRRLADYVGQERVKEGLDIGIRAARRRGEPLDHVLVYGPPGLGKTTLAYIIGHEMEVNVRVTSGPAIERPGDLAAILTGLEAHDVLFVDEVHRLSRVVEEVLYPAMEEFAIDLVIGKGPGARSLRLNLKPFTLIGATTRYAMVSAPLRDRFGAVHRLDFYSADETLSILSRSARILGLESEKEGLAEIARRYPQMNLLLDHMGYPDLKAAREAFEPIVELARFDNIHVKISDVKGRSAEDFPFADIHPFIQWLLEAFGGARVLWGTGYPGCHRTKHNWLTLADELRLVREGFSFLDDGQREQILGGTAVGVWGLA